MASSVKVAACQTPDIREDIEASLRFIETYAAKAETTGVSLLCFPECFLQGYLLNEVAARRQAFDLHAAAFAEVLARLAKIDPVLVIGLIELSAGQLHNTAAVIHQGRLLGVYRKTHLLASEQHFHPGSSYPVFEANGLKFGINICADSRYPEASAPLAAQGARVILCPANNMLEQEISEKWKHLHHEIRRERVLETGLWLISADVTGRRDNCSSLGPTAIIRPDGTLAAQVPLHEVGLVMTEIDP